MSAQGYISAGGPPHHGGAPTGGDMRSNVAERAPINPGFEQDLYHMSSAPELDQKYDSINGEIESQQMAVSQLQAQHAALEEQRARFLGDDRLAIEDRFQNTEERLKRQEGMLRSIRQQQDHIMRLMNLQDKLLHQDKFIRDFCEEQQRLITSLQPPMLAQAMAMQTLQKRQTELLDAMGQPIAKPAAEPLLQPSVFAAGQPTVPAVAYPVPHIPRPGEMPIMTGNPGDSYLGAYVGAGDGTRALKRVPYRPPARLAFFGKEPPSLGGLEPWPDHDPEVDAKLLRKAMKGLGTDNKRVIEVLSRCVNEQRQEIAQAYNSLFKLNLIDELRSETSGPFRKLLESIMTNAVEFDAQCLEASIRGMGTNDIALIELLVTRDADELRAIMDSYQTQYNKDAKEMVKEDTSGPYQAMLLALMDGGRDDEEAPINAEQVKEDATELYRAGEAKVGTDDKVFIDILTKRSFKHLKAVFEQYNKLDDYDIEMTIGRETSFNFKRALVSMVQVIRNKPLFFARQLHRSMHGTGTDNGQLIRIVVSRSEIDIKDIAREFKKEYQMTLERMIYNDTLGNFRRLLIELLGGESFDPEREAKNVKRAMGGWGSNRDKINRQLTKWTNKQRLEILDAYNLMYKRDLVKDFESELQTEHKRLAVALITEPDAFVAREVHDAIRGIGTDDASLIEILCSRSAYELARIRENYQELFGKAMVDDVKGDTSGDYKHLLVALCEAQRDDSAAADPVLARELATRLYKAGEDAWGTDEAEFISILTTHSFPQLALVFEEYSKLCDYDIEKSISRETSFNFKRALVTIVKVVRDPHDYYAERLNATMKGLGTQDNNLIRIVVSRSEIDLKEIADAYFKKFKRTLEVAIESEASMNFRRLLIHLLEFTRRQWKLKQQKRSAVQGKKKKKKVTTSNVSRPPLKTKDSWAEPSPRSPLPVQH